jgi:hypothetical protein
MNIPNTTPYIVNDQPIPYRLRVALPPPELRRFVVPRLGVRGSLVPPERASSVRLRGARAA